MTLKELLIELRACKEAREWAGDMTINQVVKKCHRGDWLVWLARNIEVDERKRYLAAGHCANTVRHLMDDERSLEAVDAAIAYGEGKISKDELILKAKAAGKTVNITDSAAFYAASAAGFSTVCAAGEAYQVKTANICRKYLGQEIITKVNEMI